MRAARELGRSAFGFEIDRNFYTRAKNEMLLLAKSGKLYANFIEGMACIGGCVGGAGCLTHSEKNRIAIDKYGTEAKFKTIKESALKES